MGAGVLIVKFSFHFEIHKEKVQMTWHQPKQLIINGTDKEPYEKGINIINPKKNNSIA